MPLWPAGSILSVVALAATAVTVGGCGDWARHPFFDRAARGRGMLTFAHRGGGGLGPEATLPLLVAADRDLGAVVEFDVHRSRDGRLVVIHDDTVDRTTNGTGRVADLTFAELGALDAGYCATPGQGDGTDASAACKAPARTGNYPFRGMGYRIPAFEEVLAALPLTAFLAIEVKAEGFEAEFAARLRASGRLANVVVGSEYDDVAVRLKDLLPEVAHFYPKSAATCLALAAKASFGYPCPEYDLFAAPLEGAGLALDTSDVLDTAHDRGIGVVYWTINDEPTIKRLFYLGADGIFTDYPDRAERVKARLAPTPAAARSEAKP
jgi:glycerophosphoryl diester phosphodiesterase